MAYGQVVQMMAADLRFLLLPLQLLLFDSVAQFVYFPSQAGESRQILFLALRILYRIVAFSLRSKKKTVLSFTNHLLGLVLGIVKVFLLGAVLSLILRFPLIQYGDVYLNQSVLRAWDPAIDSMIDYWEGWIHHETE